MKHNYQKQPNIKGWIKKNYIKKEEDWVIEVWN